MQPTIHSAPPPVLPPIDPLRRWREIIQRGNRAYDQGDDQNALHHYRLALGVADDMFGQLQDANAGVAAWVVSHHNLADAYERLGRVAEQGFHLCVAHERLHRTVDDDSLEPAWRAAAFRHSRRTYGELVRFLQRHPTDVRARAACALGAAGPASAHPIQ